jgi:hypothetical protein
MFTIPFCEEGAVANVQFCRVAKLLAPRLKAKQGVVVEALLVMNVTSIPAPAKVRVFPETLT